MTIRNVEFVNARTKLAHCLVNNISVDVTVNQIGSLLTLTFLEESELITGDANDGKKRYTITDAGRLFLSEQAVALEGIRMRMDVSKRSLRGQDRPPEIHEAVHNLRHALHSHHGRWSPEEIVRVAALLNRTAQAIADGKDQ